MNSTILNKSYSLNNIWVEDNTVNSCTNCKDTFSFFKRKHHCRLCGKIFCYKCSDYYIVTNINSKLINIEEYLMECLNYDNILTLEKKMCFHCYNLLTNIKDISKNIKVFEILPLDIIQISKLLFVSKNWNKALQYYLYKFKNIQYISTYNNMSSINYNILHNNRLNISGHNKLVANYIIYSNWDKFKKKDIDFILDNLQKRVVPCAKLLCCKDCEEKLNNYDILYILKHIKNKYVKDYLLKSLKIQDISIFIPLLLSYIKYDTIYDYSVTNYIIAELSKNEMKINIYIEIFLQLFIYIKKNKYDIYKYSLQYIKDHIQENEKELYKTITESIQVIHMLNKINIETIHSNISKINEFISNSNAIYIPLKYQKPIKYISNNITIKNSQTRPIVLKLIFFDNNEQNILLKKEDVRKDYIISKSIKLIKHLLYENNIENNLLIYDILPINDKIGLIEIVNNAYTLYDINQQQNITLQNFILSKNKDKTIYEIKDIFIKSLSIYCIITYILGIGDRHLDNIMIKDDGILFHIDFSFCLGYDPKPFAPSIRITKEMIDMIGGVKSPDYEKFIKLSNLYYNTIRKYTNLISLFIFILQEIDACSFSSVLLKEHIIKKFIFLDNDYYANCMIKDAIVNSSDNYTYIDFFHYHSKEKTVSKTFYNIYESSSTIPIFLTNYIKSVLF